METERILDKINKLQRMVESGCEKGEIENAKRIISQLCSTYNIELETLFEEKPIRREFQIPYHDKFALHILQQCYAKVTNKHTIEYSYSHHGSRIYFDLTNAQFIDLNQMYDFYFRQWKKEKKQLLDDLMAAFINKHDIFSDHAGEDTPMTPEKWERLQRIWNLEGQLEKISYLKQLE